MEQIRAAVLRSAPGRLSTETVTIDDPAPREVIVRTVAVGLCHSDLHYVDGTFTTGLPEVLGHEAAGVVERVGSEVTSVRPGDHVVACLTIFCGQCGYCTSGHLSLCENRAALRERSEPVITDSAGRPVGVMGGIGGYAEKFLMHENGLVAVDKDMPLDRACLIGCSVMTGTGAVMRAAAVPAGSDVAVFGCGGVGIAAVQGARLVGARRIIAVDLSAAKLDLARRLGATDVVNPVDGDPVEQIRELTGRGVHYSFEAIGRRDTAEQAFFALRPGGTATILGMIPTSQPLRIPGSDLFFDEKKITGSFIGSNQFRVDIPRIVDLYRQGRYELDAMISMRCNLDSINDGLDALRAGTVQRAIVCFDA